MSMSGKAPRHLAVARQQDVVVEQKQSATQHRVLPAPTPVAVTIAPKSVLPVMKLVDTPPPSPEPARAVTPAAVDELAVSIKAKSMIGDNEEDAVTIADSDSGNVVVELDGDNEDEQAAATAPAPAVTAPSTPKKSHKRANDETSKSTESTPKKRKVVKKRNSAPPAPVVDLNDDDDDEQSVSVDEPEMIGRFIIVPFSKNGLAASSRKKAHDTIVEGLTRIGVKQCDAFPKKDDGLARILIVEKDAKIENIMFKHANAVMFQGCFIVAIDKLLTTMNENGDILDGNDDNDDDLSNSQALDIVKALCVPPRTEERIEKLRFAVDDRTSIKDVKLGTIWSQLRTMARRQSHMSAIRKVDDDEDADVDDKLIDPDDDHLYIPIVTDADLRRALLSEIFPGAEPTFPSEVRNFK
jgi:hypothetical protein